MLGLKSYFERLSPAERMLEKVALGVLIALLLTCAIAYLWLPARIAVHFDWSGQVDAYGSKTALLVIAAIALGLHAFLTYLGSRGRQAPYLSNPPYLLWLKAGVMLCLAGVVLAIVVAT